MSIPAFCLHDRRNGHTAHKQGDSTVSKTHKTETTETGLVAYPTNADIVGGVQLPSGLASEMTAYVKAKSNNDPTVLRLVDEITTEFAEGTIFGIDDVFPTRETANALRLMADGLDAAWIKLFRG